MNEDFISNTSYTNKDFASIYPELLDLVKKLSNKWDPSLSNESDPGVLLLKLNALIADKCNYNIDKNVLECFPLSVTQEGNARKLYDSLGYNMHWYNSATVDVGFQIINDENFPKSYTIDKFTMVTDNSGQNTYTLLNSVYLSTATNSRYDIVTTQALEGRINTYTINGVEDISVDKLDSDLRLYFEEPNIAENGIFIRTAGIINQDWDWQRVDNLSAYPLGNKVYQFGVLPNSNTCYIQFPEDITNLLATTPSINIKYIVSNGESGNIKANVLDSFIDDLTTVAEDGSTITLNDQIRIIQTNPSYDGKDPESIDEAYRNYKKVQGTFNTLVTRRDYENFIYNARDSIGNLVSNCVVADRTNDINCSTKVKEYSPTYESTKVSILGNILKPYNIVLYALNAGDGTYNSTFEPITDTTIISRLVPLVEEVKSIQHIFETPISAVGQSILYLFKNLYAINGQLVTYSKVTEEEALEIETNVTNKLNQTYNARQINFGEEVNYNELIETIVSADARIRTVALDIPKYQISKVTKAGGDVEGEPINDNDKIALVARMILQGNVQLFKFEDSFDYEFGQTDIQTIGTEENPIKTITTKAEIVVPAYSSDKPYTLKKNETIQIFAPNFVTTTEYSLGVKVAFTTSDTTETPITIVAGKDYLLGAGQQINIQYTDTNNIIQNVTIPSGTCINSSVELVSGSSAKTLLSGQTLKVKEINKSTLPIGTKYYFIVNNPNNTLEITENSPYILRDNEYFIYTNPKTTELVILGAGTQLSGNLAAQVTKIEPTKIQSEGVSSIDWLVLTSALTTTELMIISVGEGGTIKSADSVGSAKTMTLSNDISTLGQDNNPNSIIITGDSGTQTISTYIEGGETKYYQLFSTLNINSTKDNPQELFEGQTFEVTLKEDNTPIIVANTNISFNEDFAISGGENLDMATLDAKGNYNYTLIGYTYNKTKADYNVTRNNNVLQFNGDRSSSKYVKLDENKSAYYLPFTFAKGTSTNENWLLPIFSIFTQAEGDNKGFEFYTSNSTFSEEDLENVKAYTTAWLNPTINGTATISFKDITGDIAVNSIIINEAQLVKGKITSRNVEEQTAVITTTKSVWTDVAIKEYAINESTFKTTSTVLDISNANTTYNLKIVFNQTVLTDNLLIGKITKTNGLNADEIDVIPSEDNTYSDRDKFILEGTGVIENLISAIKSWAGEYKFDWTYRVPEDNKVIQPTLSSSYWNTNHIANKYTISQINLDKSNIKVNTYYINK